MTKVLIVEDDPQLRRALAINLRARRYDVHAVGDGTTALAAAAADLPDIVILDLGLPDIDGVDVVSGLRGWTDVPIIVLSARDAQGAKVDALDAGADDYVTKPFGMDELLARLRASLRRAAPGGDVPTLAAGTLVIDRRAKRVTRAGQDVRLTPTEWHLLEVLVRDPGRLIPGRQLLQEVWGPTYGDESNYLRVYMATLRRKLEENPSTPHHLITEPGLGYRFEL
ncbi:response regulator [Pedococcus sp. P5_B7]